MVLTSVAVWGLGGFLGWEFRGSSVELIGEVLAFMGAAPLVLPEGIAVVLPADFFKPTLLIFFNFFAPLFAYNPKKNW